LASSPFARATLATAENYRLDYEVTPGPRPALKSVLLSKVREEFWRGLMSAVRDVAVLVGSLRKDSINRKVAHALTELAPYSLKLEIVEIGQLPLYNQDSDQDPPKAYLDFRARVKAADAVLFVTPEHNRSVPAAMKNAIDVGSRPYGASAWNGKPAAVISASPSKTGGFGANHHLRQSLVWLNVPAMPQPEAYVGEADKLFDASGKLANDSTRKFLQNFIEAFANWIEVHIKS
jgi:chromate reductase, NAD(P)H dehydrogenase (quinone)